MIFCLADLSGASAKNWNTGKKQQSSNGISDIKQIIIGDMGKGYDFEKRNVASKEALKILNIKAC